MAHPLISPEHLAPRLGDPGLRIVDVRWYLGDPRRGALEYAEGHIPGAVFCDLETDLCAPEGPGRHPLPDPSSFTATLGQLGIKPEHEVVAYDASGGAVAARLWWMLVSIGHAEAAVLDGGWQRWINEHRPVTDEIPRQRPASYPPVDGWSGTVDRRQLAVGLGNHPIIDARAPERYRGEVEPIDPRPGHIPSAVNRPFRNNLGPDGRFRSRSELHQLYHDVADPSAVVYCGSGVTACHDILAMVVAGHPRPLLYPGSWSDWCSWEGIARGLGEGPE